MSSSIDHSPSVPWTFDQSVTECFEDMLQRSIPDYFGMRKLVTDLAVRYTQPNTHVIDLGCSRGEMIARLKERIHFPVCYVGMDNSLPMVQASRERFKEDPDVAILDHDLIKGFPHIPLRPSVVLSVLTLQFIPVEHRERILKGVYESLLPGGCFILIEKVEGISKKLDDLFVDLYHQMKHENGYSWESIQAKQKALENVLIPIPAKWNEELLMLAGFNHVECFWRHLNFAGFIAIK